MDIAGRSFQAEWPGIFKDWRNSKEGRHLELESTGRKDKVREIMGVCGGTSDHADPCRSLLGL